MNNLGNRATIYSMAKRQPKPESIQLFEHAKKKRVQQTREYLKELFLTRAKIGQVATQYVEMKWAEFGFRGRIPSQFRYEALKEFAKAIGVSFTTLYDWVQSVEASLFCARKRNV